jgi:hypothetical protein
MWTTLKKNYLLVIVAILTIGFGMTTYAMKANQLSFSVKVCCLLAIFIMSYAASNHFFRDYFLNQRSRINHEKDQ